MLYYIDLKQHENKLGNRMGFDHFLRLSIFVLFSAMKIASIVVLTNVYIVCVHTHYNYRKTDGYFITVQDLYNRRHKSSKY